MLELKTSYTLADAKGVQDQSGHSEKVLTVPMVFKTPEGVEIIKTFYIYSRSISIVVKHQVVNHVANKTGKVRCLDIVET